MFGITDLSTYLIGTIAIIVLPGPNSMYCLAVAGQYGARAAYRTAAGIVLGDAILMLATALGAGTVLKLYPWLFHAIKLVGGLYLAYLGWGLLRGAVKKWHLRLRPSGQGAAPAQAASQRFFSRALLLSTTNPKVILFCLSFFVQFVDQTYPNPALSFFILAAFLQLFSVIYLNILIFGGRALSQRFQQHQRMAAASMGAVGLMFIGFAVKMWTAAI